MEGFLRAGSIPASAIAAGPIVTGRDCGCPKRGVSVFPRPMTRDLSDRRPPGRAGLLLPWLLAPAWLFLPLVGCGLADSAFKPQRAETVAGMPVVPVESTVTVAAAPMAGR